MPRLARQSGDNPLRSFPRTLFRAAGCQWRLAGGNHAALGLWRLSHRLRAAAAEPIGLSQTKGYIYNRVSPRPFPGCEAPVAPRRGDPRRGSPRRGSPREKTVHRTVFSPRPALRFALSVGRLLGVLRGISRSAERNEGLRAPRPARPFEKGRRKLFIFPAHSRSRVSLTFSAGHYII